MGFHMKRFLCASITLSALLLSTSVQADMLISDIDTSILIDNYDWDNKEITSDTNPDFVSPNDEVMEERWLEALLGLEYDSSLVNFIDRQAPSGLDDLTTWISYNPATWDPKPISGWDYAIVKIGGGGQDIGSHYAFHDTGDDDLLTYPTYPNGTEFTLPRGVSHITFFSGSSAEVPEPATMFIFGTGLVALAGIGAKRKK